MSPIMRVRRALLEAGESPDERGQQRPGRAGAVRSLRTDQNPRQASGGPTLVGHFKGRVIRDIKAPSAAQLVGGPPDLPGVIYLPPGTRSGRRWLQV